MKRPSDAELTQEAFDLVADRPEGDRLRQIVAELRSRTSVSHGQQKYVTAWAAGRLARRNGLPVDSCPYVEKVPGRRTFATAYRNAWIRGWNNYDMSMRPHNLRRARVCKILTRRRTGTS